MIGSILATAVLLLLTLWLFTTSKAGNKFYVISLAVILIGGTLIYGYVYRQTEANPFLVPLKAVLAILGMFVGRDNYSEALKTDLFQHQAWQVAFWVVHAFAIYITASATAKLLGEVFKKQFNFIRKRRQSVAIIFGLNRESLAFGKTLEKNETVVYLDRESTEFSDKLLNDKSKHSQVNELGKANYEKLFKKFKLDAKRSKISIYALSDDYEANRKFALLVRDLVADAEQKKMLRDAFYDWFNQEKDYKQLKPKLYLTVFGEEEFYIQDKALNDFAGLYITNPFVLSGRQLIQQSPPYQIVNFERGQVTDGFHLLQIGFGHIGQEVFKQIYMNAHFGSHRFKADIFAPDVTSNTGRIKLMTNMIDETSVVLHACKGESDDFYQFIDKHRLGKKYIVIATGDAERNREFARQVQPFFPDSPIHIVETTGVTVYGDKTYSNFTTDLLFSANLDHRAKKLNYAYYHEENNDEQAQWLETSYFHRMSSRASADFSGALIKASGTFEVRDGQLEFPVDWLESIQKNSHLYESLGRLEHERWNAFHRAMGFVTMSESVIRQRAQDSKETNQKKFIKEITQDMSSRQHACLIDWEDLPWLDDLVEELCQQYLGKVEHRETYQEIDKGFVAMVPELQEIKEV